LASYRAAPWVPARKKDLLRITELAGIKKDEVVYELGSGDGRVTLELAKRYDAQFIGYEISFIPYLVSRIRLFFLNNFFVHRLKGRVKILYKDFFRADFSQANVIVFFLTPYGLKKLESKFKKEMKKDSRIVSYVFPIKAFTPAVVSKPTETSNSIYCYRF